MNWGKGIAIFLTVFVLFILGLVYMTTRSTFDLEAEDYYAQEIAYQDRIEALRAGAIYQDLFTIESRESEVYISQNEASLDQIQEATITFYRPNDARLDRAFELVFINGQASFPKSEFTKGKYEVRMEWKLDEVLHALTSELNIN